MCDVQIVTGLGILVSGYADLKCGISAYHFLLVGLVAWFSNLTHIAGLTVLRQYLHRRPFERWIRLFFMIALSVMLLIAMGPTLFFNWAALEWSDVDEGSAGLPGSYAICFFNIKRSIEWHYADADARVEASSTFQSVLISMLLLVFSLVSRTIKLQSSLSSAVTRTRKHVSDRYKAYVRRLYGITPVGTRPCIRTGWASFIRTGWPRRTVFFTQMTSLLVVRTYADLLTSTLSDVGFLSLVSLLLTFFLFFFLSFFLSVFFSFLLFGKVITKLTAQVYWLVVSAIWGTIKLFLAKQSAHVIEDSWTFGQVLPAFLLLAPLFTTAQILAQPLEDASDASETDNTTACNQPDPGSTSPRSTPGTALPGFDPCNDMESDEGGVPLETRRFRQHVQNSLARDFFHAETCAWMPPAVVLACMQILAATVLFFIDLSYPSTSPATVLASYSIFTFVVSPSACFIYIYLSFFFEHFFPLFRPWHAWASWALMLVTFALYGLYPVWDIMYGPGSVLVVDYSSSVDFVIIVVAGFILVLELYSILLPAMFWRAREANVDPVGYDVEG